MTENEINELAKAAAHSAVVARYSQTTPDEKTAVNTFLEAYEYALIQIHQKERQVQSQLPPEFRQENHTRFR